MKISNALRRGNNEDWGLCQQDMYVSSEVGRHRSLAGVTRYQVQRSGTETIWRHLQFQTPEGPSSYVPVVWNSRTVPLAGTK